MHLSTSIEGGHPVLGHHRTTFGHLASLAHTPGLPVSLLGVTQVLWIETGVCSVLSAGHWHVWLMSARPQRNAPDWRHCTDSTFGSLWKQGWAQLPLPWNPLVVFCRQTLISFFLRHSPCLSCPICCLLFVPVCLSVSCLRDSWRSGGNWRFEMVSRELYTAELFKVFVIVILLTLMKITGIRPWTDQKCMCIYVWAFKSPLDIVQMSVVVSIHL